MTINQAKKGQQKLTLRAGDQLYTADGEHICMAKGCSEVATYPAPKNRHQLRSYIWFCLDHIRCYNRSWNYYDGLEGDALEAEIRRATTWERPSWAFGASQSAKSSIGADFSDPLNLFSKDKERAPTRSKLSDEERRAWAIFNLPPDSSPAILKKHYNQLARQLHPDHNQNNPKAEEKLKNVNLAYSFLRKKMADIN